MDKKELNRLSKYEKLDDKMDFIFDMLNKYDSKFICNKFRSVILINNTRDNTYKVIEKKDLEKYISKLCTTILNINIIKYDFNFCDQKRYIISWQENGVYTYEVLDNLEKIEKTIKEFNYDYFALYNYILELLK